MRTSIAPVPCTTPTGSWVSLSADQRDGALRAPGGLPYPLLRASQRADFDAWTRCYRPYLFLLPSGARNSWRVVLRSREAADGNPPDWEISFGWSTNDGSGAALRLFRPVDPATPFQKVPNTPAMAVRVR